MISDLINIANKFNQYFAHIGSSTLADKIPSAPHCNSYLSNPVDSVFSFHTVTEENISHIINKLKNKVSYSLSARILHRAPPPPAPSGPKFSNSENCCGSENAMPLKIFWDMEGHRGHFRSKNVFFFKKHILEKIHNKSHYFFKF